MRIRNTVARGRISRSLPPCALGTLIAQFCMTAPAHAQHSDGAEGRGLEEVVVTGSYLRRQSQAELASPTQVLSAEALERTGFSSIAAILDKQTANIGSVGGVQDLAGGGADNRVARSANLRGLGPSATLVLLNGRRIASAEGIGGFNYVNLAALAPLIDVQRVETVLDGASALYGSDAIAGVINVITDDEFDGLAANVQYNYIEDAPGYLVQLKMGGGTERSHTVVSLSYEFMDNLQNADRDATNFLNTSGLSQPGNFVVRSRPQTAAGGDVIIDNGVNGLINYSQIYDQRVAATGNPAVQFADPWCTAPGTGGIYSPRAAGSPFPDGACRFSFQAANPIKPEARIILAHVDSKYDLAEAHEAFVEARFYRQESRRFGIGSVPLSNGSPTVPASNPFNPFGVDATFSGRVLGVNAPPLMERVDVTGTHIVAGVRGDLFADWNYSADAVWSQEKSNNQSKDTDLILLQHALNGFGGQSCNVGFAGPAASEVAGQGNCVYFSPFGRDQLTNDPRTNFSLLQPTLVISEVNHLLVEGVISGRLFDLPGGAAGLAIGGQTRAEEAVVDYDDFTQSGRAAFRGRSLSGSGERRVNAGFVELDLPVLPRVDVQLAARYEDYGEFTTTDPKLGLNWRATDWLTLRASASSAFKAPSLQQSASTSITANVGQTRDPLDPLDTGTFRVINQVNNPNLEPEESENFNVGITVEPLAGLELSADYWNFRFENQVAAESAQVVLNANPNGPQAIRDPATGRLLGVNVGYFNAGQTQTSGVDLRLSYGFDLGAHAFSISNSLTWLETYEVQIGPGQAVLDGVGRRNANKPGAPAPEFRDNLSIDWSFLQHNARLTLRYTDSVLDDVFLPVTATPTNEIGSWTVFDGQYSYAFGPEAKTRIAIGAINLFDRDPPAATFTGYVAALADALGRQAYLRLDVGF
jgi:iron complex outermembrane receptor protein